MTRFDDDRDMRWTRDDRLLAGDLAEEEPELTALVSAVRSMADAPRLRRRRPCSRSCRRVSRTHRPEPIRRSTSSLDGDSGAAPGSG